VGERLWDHDAEIALLAAAFTSPVARGRARRIIVGSDFLQPKHETVWQAMLALDRRGIGVDAVTLRAALEGEHCEQLVLEVATAAMTTPANVEHYAGIVHQWAVRRRVDSAARRVLNETQAPVAASVGWVAEVARRFADIRDLAEEDVEGDLTAAELVEQSYSEPDWLIPGLLERRDRLMLTGEEGLGKSHLLRQLATHAAGGLQPFEPDDPYTPVRALLIDCENTQRQIARALQPQMEYVARWARDPSRMLRVWTTSLNLTVDRDVSRLHQMLDRSNPEVVVIGPLHLLVPPGGLNKEEDASVALAALNGIRARGCAVLVEAHAGHETVGYSKTRSLRPRGSSSLMGWPEFGYGLRKGATVGYAELVPWRGNRAERSWPTSMRRADGFRWVPT
jgi:replicative DNA helicase